MIKNALILNNVMNHHLENAFLVLEDEIRSGYIIKKVDA
jgi:hypothetical protein